MRNQVGEEEKRYTKLFAEATDRLGHEIIPVKRHGAAVQKRAQLTF